MVAAEAKVVYILVPNDTNYWVRTLQATCLTFQGHGPSHVQRSEKEPYG